MTRNSIAGVGTFFLIAFGVPWAGWLIARDERLSLWLFPLFCSLAGFAAAFIEGGSAGFRTFSRRVFGTGRSLRYVGFALPIPLMLGLGYLLTKGIPLSGLVLSPAAILGLALGAALVTGPLAEEFGWRGYLQHTLLGRLAPLGTAVVLGGIWWAWHLPLYWSAFVASPFLALSFLGYLVTWSIFMVYLVERAGGAVWPAVAFHWAANVNPDVLRTLFPGIDGSLLPGGSKGALFFLAAASVFVAINRRFFFTRTSPVPRAAADNSFTAAALPTRPRIQRLVPERAGPPVELG